MDLMTQFVLGLAMKYMSEHNEKYPVGRSRLEALAVLACSGIMFVTSIEVIQYAAQDLVEGFGGNKPTLNIGAVDYIILSAAVTAKALLYMYCNYLGNLENSDSMYALAEDHINDVVSNSVTIVAVSIAMEIKSVWWLDGIMAIVISLVIIIRWSMLIVEQVRKLVGFTAPPEFIAKVNELALEHDKRVQVDCTRAYYFGYRYNVEMEIILPGDMTVAESHDIALALQHKIEEMDDVERAFVHVDHLPRSEFEHKVERQLAILARAKRSHDDLTQIDASIAPGNSDPTPSESPVADHPVEPRGPELAAEGDAHKSDIAPMEVAPAAANAV
jgi:cation diffusion facilitator family transporter